MGIFTRFRDIISSNINAMLDKAEDPEKLLRLMIQEMEETLVELKAACAAAMASTLKVRREWEQIAAKAESWHAKAGIAVAKGREDLAREALLEKRALNAKAQRLAEELHENEGIIEGYKTDIETLEEKLNAAREKQRLLVQRHRRAQGKKRAQGDLRRVQANSAMLRFDEFEQRIDRLEAEADLAGPWPRTDADRSEREPPFTLEEKFAMLEVDEGIEQELEALRRQTAPASHQPGSMPREQDGGEH
ncbi:MAG TPA: phage shock protein A [Desulfonatronum sp.]|nr:phage shock protein A [Desulfonatronum sp.]